uniref:UNC93-like protein MFSD11 n=1 Tax=Cacopsylla melanoneura TaxID=428564 RepID=A0A8D9AMI0_9HEMI
MVRQLPFDRSTLNVIFIGICFAFIFTAYFTLSNLEKILLNSLQHDDPTFHGDGYISQGIIYAAFSVCLWFAPSVNSVLGSKMTMVIGVIGYEAYICSHFFHITWIIYLSSLMIGIGASLVWTGQGSYLVMNSKQDTLERNLGVFQILFTSGSLTGNIFIYFAFLGKQYIDEATRQLVILFLCIILNVGGAMLLLLPKPDKGEAETQLKVKPSDEKQDVVCKEFALVQNEEGAWKTFTKSVSIMCTKNFLILCFMFSNIGFTLAFTVIYNSCMGFTMNIPHAKEWVPLGGFASGVGGVFGGLLPILMDTEAKLPFKMRPLMFIGFFSYIISYVIAFLNFPDESIFGDTEATAYMPGNPYLCLFGTLILHMGECVFATETQTLLAKMFPSDTIPAFAISSFVRMLFTSAAFNISTVFGLHFQLICLSVLLILGVLSFAYVTLSVHKREEEQMIKPTSPDIGGKDNPAMLVERF